MARIEVRETVGINNREGCLIRQSQNRISYNISSFVFCDKTFSLTIDHDEICRPKMEYNTLFSSRRAARVALNVIHSRDFRANILQKRDQITGGTRMISRRQFQQTWIVQSSHCRISSEATGSNNYGNSCAGSNLLTVLIDVFHSENFSGVGMLSIYLNNFAIVQYRDV